MIIKVKNTGLLWQLYEYGDVHVMFSAPDEVDNYAEEILEAMVVDSQQEEMKNEDRIPTLEADFKQEKQQRVQLYKISSP